MIDRFFLARRKRPLSVVALPSVPVSGNVLVAYDPSSIVAAGGLLSAWNDRSVNGYHIDREDPAFGAGATQPAVDEEDDDFGTAVVTDSDSDHRATDVIDLSELAGTNTDSYFWLVLKSTHTGATAHPIVRMEQDSDRNIFTQISKQATDLIHLNNTSLPGATVNAVTALNGVPRLIEFKNLLSANTQEAYLDGTLVDTETVNSNANLIGTVAASRMIFGRSISGGAVALQASWGVLMIETGIPSAGRLTEVREWARDEMGCVNIP